METLVNRVAESGIETINLEDWYPEYDMINFDIKEYLFHGLILKEKDFRESLKSHDWEIYKDKIVLIVCSADAIIPMWAYMLITTYLQERAKDVFVGNLEEYLLAHYKSEFDKFDPYYFNDKRVVIKGCSNKHIPPYAYAGITFIAMKYAKSVMFGEPCSTVPVFKQKIVNR
jgi:hypothetical protein